MIRSSLRTTATILPCALLLLTACGTDTPTAPDLSPALSRTTASADRPTIAVCPTAESYQTEGVLGPRGGSLQVAGHRLFVPPGVLSEATHFSLRAPASPYVMLELSAMGVDHYQFRAPVVVTISYDRCRRQHRLGSAASAWYLDEGGNRLELMPGKDDRRNRAVTFRTTHFSTYLVAY